MNLQASLKKIFTLLTIVLLAVLVIGCGDKEDDGDNAEAQVGKVYLQTLEAYLNDIPLPKYVQGNREAVLTWTSSNPDVVTVQEYADDHANKDLYFLGKITMPESQIIVDLTATVKYKGETAKHIFKIKVGNAYEEMTIKQAKAASKGSFVKLEGTVIFTADSGYAIKDDTGYMYLYLSKHGRKVGEKVVAYGETDIYNFMPQLARSSSTVVGNEPAGFNPADDAATVEIRELVAKDKGDKDLFSTMFNIKGTVKKSDNSANPYNIVNPLNPDEYIGVTKYSAAASLDKLATLVNKNVEVSVIIYDNRDGKFSVLFPETYTEYEVVYTDQERADVSLAELQTQFAGMIVTGNISLPATSRLEAEVTWASGNKEILTDAGVLVNSDVDQDVVFTITTTYNGKTATGEVTVQVKKLEASKVSAILPKTPLKSTDPKVLVLVEGEVVAHQFRGWWVADETGAVLVYTGVAHDPVKNPYPAIGTMVSVKGQLTTFGEANSFTSQISPLDVKTITKEKPTTIAPVEVTFEQLFALNITDYASARAAGMQWYGKFIKITGEVDGSGNFWYIRGTQEGQFFRLNNLFSNEGLVKGETVTITLMVRDFYFIEDASGYNNYKAGTPGGVFFGKDTIVK